MAENTQQYDENQIQVMEGLEAVRKRPGMYIGSTSVKGLDHLVYEIVDNAIDEALAGYCKNIWVTIDKGNIVTVLDDGRGIPTGIHPKMGISTLEVVYTILHAGGKFGGGGYKISGGLHGVGASVVNALSEWLKVEVYNGGKIHTQSYHRGKPDSPVTVIGDTDKHGTKCTFYPDSEIFETVEFEYDSILHRLREQAFLCAGIHIIFTDNRGDEPVVNDMLYEGGIKTYAEYLNKTLQNNPIHDVIYISKENETNSAEVAIQYTDAFKEHLYSYANNIRTIDGGTHDVGFKSALTNVINDYARKYKFLKEKEDNLGGDVVREGIMAIISVKLTDPEFEGQTKTKLGNSEMRAVVSNLITEKLSIYLEENPNVAKAIIDKALFTRRVKEAARKAIEDTRRNSALDSGQMPDKLRDCNERDPQLTELYIVEGDSAGGSATQGRDSRFQAILPLWGKMLNVEKARNDKVIGNEKLAPVITALGSGLKDDFNPEKLRYHKIIIMADADVDGAHIRTLLLTFFFRFMRPLIDNGYVYSAVPPLYKLTRGKNTKVAYSDEERDRISAELKEGNPNAKVDISRYKGLGEMNPQELWETTMDPERRTLRKITLEDAEEADRIFSILMGEQVDPRREYIEENARYAVNLDY